MRASSIVPAIAAFAVAACAAVFGADLAVGQIEDRSVRTVNVAMGQQGHDWVEVAADGLQLELTGTAPDEATRFRALNVAGSIVDGTRIIDRMEVAAAAVIEAPRFSVEILRNAEGISLIGLIPVETDRTALRDRIGRINGGGTVGDLLDAADFPAPDGWDDALEFGLNALASLPRSKISIAADAVAIDAISDSREAKRRLESDLSRAAPDGLSLSMTIAAPRPVITPFTLRFLITDDGPRFDACSAAAPEGRDAIVAAARAAGLEGQVDCTIGLGVPSPEWPRAAVASIDTLGGLGAGSVTISDADITLVADAGTSQTDFDRAVGELEGALPLGFSLFSVLPEPVETGEGRDNGPPEFVATKAEDGRVRLGGRIPDDRARLSVTSMAHARFTTERVTDATRVDGALPAGWVPRALGALDSLSLLHNGSVVVQPRIVSVQGVTGNPDARAEISRILSDQLGSAEDYTLDITYDKKLDPVLGLPTPQECVDDINTILSEQKIVFAPGSAEIETEADGPVDLIADMLRKCDDVIMEIGGHTDSQGSEGGNQRLSQERADALLLALSDRRVATSNLVAVGYGEENPIAPNDTETGREANRRLEFKLISVEEDAAPEGAGEQAESTISDVDGSENEQD